MIAENVSFKDEMPPAVPIKPGQTFFFPVSIPVQVEIAGVMTKMRSVSVGYLPGYCLIIKYPATTFSIASKLFVGNSITVRYINGGDVFGFRSNLLRITTDPPPLLFIAYPTSIERRSLRSSRRIECNLPADLRSDGTKDDNVAMDGIISDMSMAGYRFTMINESEDQALPEIKIDDKVVVDVQFPGTEAEMELSGSIKNIQRDNRRISVGVQFNDINEENRMRLLEFISTLEKFSWEQ